MTNETRAIVGLKRVSANADYMAVFLTINNTGMMINAGVNVKT